MPQHTEAERRRGLTPGLISNIEGFEAIPPGVLQRILGERAGGMAERVADFFTEGMFNREDPRMGEQFPGRPGPVDALIAALGVKGIGSLAKRGYNSLVRPGFGASKTSKFGLSEGPIGRREFFNRASGRPRRNSISEVSDEMSELLTTSEDTSNLEDLVWDQRIKTTSPAEPDFLPDLIDLAKEEGEHSDVINLLMKRRGFDLGQTDRQITDRLGFSNKPGGFNPDLVDIIPDETLSDLDRVEQMNNRLITLANELDIGTSDAGSIRKIITESPVGRFFGETARSMAREAGGPEIKEAEEAIKSTLDDLFNRFGIKRGRQ
jgi:hypothetical protein